MPRQRDARAQLADEPGRVERRAARQLVAVEQHDVALAELREVVGDRRAADAAADDDHARARAAHAVGHCLTAGRATSHSSKSGLAADRRAQALEVLVARSRRSRSRARRSSPCTTPHAASRASERIRISASAARRPSWAARRSRPPAGARIRVARRSSLLIDEVAEVEARDRPCRRTPSRRAARRPSPVRAMMFAGSRSLWQGPGARAGARPRSCAPTTGRHGMPPAACRPADDDPA